LLLLLFLLLLSLQFLLLLMSLGAAACIKSDSPQDILYLIYSATAIYNSLPLSLSLY